MKRGLALSGVLAAFAAFADVPFDNTINNDFWDTRQHANLPAHAVSAGLPSGSAVVGACRRPVVIASLEIGKTFDFSNIIKFTSFPSIGLFLFFR